MNILYNSKDSDRYRNNSIHEGKHYNYTTITKTSNFHSHTNFLNVKNSLLIFTIFSIVLPVGIQPQLPTTEAFDQSVINDNINGMSSTDSQIDDQSSTESSSSTSQSQISAQSSNEVYGDFNGDGFDDLAIGVPLEDVVSAGDNAGAVNVIYGSSNGLSATTPRPDQFWTQNSDNVGDSSEAGERFGSSLATGDFNADGFDDLAIGVPNENSASGAVNVLYGSSNGLSATSPRPDQFWTQNSDNVGDSSEADDRFGLALTAGDFNGDGNDDLAIGVSEEDVVSAGDNAGAVNVIYGSSNGLSATTPRPDQFWTQNSDNVGDSSEVDDRFGSSLATGDFNGDGFDDLAIGAFFENLVIEEGVSITGAGAVNVMYGSSNGLSSTSPLPDQFWTQDTEDVNNAAESGDGFGSSLSAGDFNGDGFADLAIGVPNENRGISVSISEVGAVNVIYGSSNGLSVTLPLLDQFWTQDTANVNDLEEFDDLFGFSLSAGDFNGDGNDDLAIGVFRENVVSQNDNAGAVNVIYGSLSGLSATIIPDQFWTQNSANVEDSSEVGDVFGGAVASSDFNGDGFDDLAIGVRGEDVVSLNDDAGAVNVIYGSSSGLSATTVPDQDWTQNDPNVADSSEAVDTFGNSLT